MLLVAVLLEEMNGGTFYATGDATEWLGAGSRCLPKEAVQLLRVLCAAVSSSRAAKGMAAYDAGRVFFGLVLSAALPCSTCKAESLVCCCCFLLLVNRPTPVFL